MGNERVHAIDLGHDPLDGAVIGYIHDFMHNFKTALSGKKGWEACTWLVRAEVPKLCA